MSLDLDLGFAALLGECRKQGTLKKNSPQKDAMGKDKKQPAYSFVPSEKVWKPTRLVLLTHLTICDCCGEIYEHPNYHILKELRNKRGETHLVHDYSTGDSRELPREQLIEEHHVRHCMTCFDEAELEPCHLVLDPIKTYSREAMDNEDVKISEDEE